MVVREVHAYCMKKKPTNFGKHMEEGGRAEIREPGSYMIGENSRDGTYGTRFQIVKGKAHKKPTGLGQTETGIPCSVAKESCGTDDGTCVGASVVRAGILNRETKKNTTQEQYCTTCDARSKLVGGDPNLLTRPGYNKR